MRVLPFHLPYLLLLTVVILFHYGTLLNGWADIGHDSLACVVRLLEYKTEFDAGYLHPQLFNESIRGATHAFPVFYPPMGYIAALPILGVTGDPIFSSNLSFFLSVLLSGYAAYMLGFVVSKRRVAALLCALVYCTATYRFVNITVRGALAECWVMVWLPVILTGFFLLYRGKRGMGLVALGTTGALLSHLPVFLWFGVLIVFLNIPLFLKRGIWGVVRYGLAGVLGLAGAAFFLIPQQMMLPEVHASNPGYMWASWKSVVEHQLLFSQLFEVSALRWEGGSQNVSPFVYDTMSFHIGLGGMLGTAAMLVLLLPRRVFLPTLLHHPPLNGGWAKRALLLVLGLVWVFYLLIMFRTNWFYWLPEKFGYLQFPWRLLSLLALVHGLACALFGGEFLRRQQTLLWVACAVVAFSVPTFANNRTLHKDAMNLVFENKGVVTASVFETDFSHRMGGTAIAEYTPKDFPVWTLRENWQQFELPPAGFAEGSGSIEVLEKKPGHWRVRITSTGDSIAYIPTLYYSFWKAETTTGEPLELFSSNGFLAFRLKGSPTPMEVEFRRFYPWFYPLGWSISLTALTLIGILLLPIRGKRITKRPA